MTSDESSRELQIIRAMKRVLTDIAKDTYTPPGQRHPLSDKTILGIRDCLSLITAREVELAEAKGESMDMRPRYADDPNRPVVVPLSQIGGKKGPTPGKDGDSH
ncbi:MAG: segregation and condensation protein A [Gammaproteobacteria bacterium]